VSFLLEYGFQLSPFFKHPIEFPPGPSPRVFPTLIERVGYEVVGVNLSNYDVYGLLVAIFLMLALQYIVFRTRFGTAMRAVSFDWQVAGLMGIPVNKIISWTFVLGSALAAAAGIINAVARPKIEPLFGLMIGLKAFVAAVLGGIGHVPGAMAGGLVLGLAEEYVAGYTDSSYRDAIAFTVLILVLLVRPTGLFGASPWRRCSDATRTDRQVVPPFLLALPVIVAIDWATRRPGASSSSASASTSCWRSRSTW